jgi:hypothetical protein
MNGYAKNSGDLLGGYTIIYSLNHNLLATKIITSFVGLLILRVIYDYVPILRHLNLQFVLRVDLTAQRSNLTFAQLRL